MSSPARAGRVVRDSLSGPKAVRTREILVEAAGEQFLEHGYAETTVEHIADGAKVSRPTFYTYFRSKREIFEAVALVASDAVGVVFDDLGALPAQWTTEDIARWIGSYFACQRLHGPWALVWQQAAREDREVKEIGRANRRYHARKIGKHLRGLGLRTDNDPIYDGLIVLAILESLWSDGQRVGGSDEFDRRHRCERDRSTPATWVDVGLRWPAGCASAITSQRDRRPRRWRREEVGMESPRQGLEAGDHPRAGPGEQRAGVHRHDARRCRELGHLEQATDPRPRRRRAHTRTA